MNQQPRSLTSLVLDALVAAYPHVNWTVQEDPGGRTPEISKMTLLCEKPERVLRHFDNRYVVVSISTELLQLLAFHGWDLGRGIFDCTEQHPWSGASVPRGLNVTHKNAGEIGTCAMECCAIYRCRDCGTEWRSELPQ